MIDKNTKHISTPLSSSISIDEFDNSINNNNNNTLLNNYFSLLQLYANIQRIENEKDHIGFAKYILYN